jgi:hypothetical protein
MRHTRITQKDVLFLSISFFTIVAAWVAFSLYHSYVTTTISEDLQMQILPINPKFDTATIEALKSRKKVTPLFEVNPAEASTPALLVPEELVPTAAPIEDSIEELDEIITTEEPTPAEESTPVAEPTP